MTSAALASRIIGGKFVCASVLKILELHFDVFFFNYSSAECGQHVGQEDEKGFIVKKNHQIACQGLL